MTDHIPPQQELRQKIHMQMLSKSKNAKDVGDLTVVPLGFAVTIAVELLAQTRTDTIREVEEVLLDPDNTCSGYMCPHEISEPHWIVTAQELEQLKGQK